jgi:hypothetical protein
MPAAKADKCLHYHSPKLVAVNAEGGILLQQFFYKIIFFMATTLNRDK